MTLCRVLDRACFATHGTQVTAGNRVEAGDYRSWSELEEAVATFGLTLEVLNPNGPGGGNPQCEVVGTPADIVRFLEESGYCDPEDVPFQTDRITF